MPAQGRHDDVRATKMVFRRLGQLQSAAFKHPVDTAERRPIFGGKQTGRLRKYRQGTDALSIRPSKIGWSEGTRRAGYVGARLLSTFRRETKSTSPRPATRAYKLKLALATPYFVRK